MTENASVVAGGTSRFPQTPSSGPLRGREPRAAAHGSGFTLWFTGLSGAGKTTIAELVRPELERRGLVVEWLDGDEGWRAVDELAHKYIGAPYSRELDRVVALIEVDHHQIGM